MLVYYCRNAEQLSPQRLTELVACLPQQQQDIIARIKSHRQKCEQVLAYIMLCYAIEHNQDEIASDETLLKEFNNSNLIIQNSELPLWAFGEHGKPYITNYEGIHFNISHCREAVAVGISDSEIGIDIEGRRRFSDTLLQRAFSDDEQATIKKSNDPQKDFASIWTRKEAYFKLTGTGILMDHLKTTEDEARRTGCNIETIPIFNTEQGHDDFWLSIAQKQRTHLY